MSEFNQQFLNSSKPHILMITNHGIHDWDVRSGLKDTGGQNHYVNALSHMLSELGFRITTLNRGGYNDPVTGECRKGISCYNENERIIYLEDSVKEFIRKEDLNTEILQEESKFAIKVFQEENSSFDLMISHYWDGAILGDMLKTQSAVKCSHVWIPHSLGALKKENFINKPQDVIDSCRFEERITYEHKVCEVVDYIASTSSDITRISNEVYNKNPELFLPPCIETNEVFPMDINKADGIYNFLAKSDTTGADVKGKKCVLEVSRTDITKRKDIVIRAFAQSLKDNSDSMLLLTISPDKKEVYEPLMNLINELNIRDKVVCLGMIPRALISELYAITTVYISPSDMEGFGMSVQEAAAAKRATISSSLVPFAVEYLTKDYEVETVNTKSGKCNIKWGKGGCVVDAGNAEGFGYALNELLLNQSRREIIAQEGYDITIPYFTWACLTKDLLNEVNVKVPFIS